MIKKVLLFVIVLVCFLFEIVNASNVYNISYGTSDYGIKLPNIVNVFAVAAYDNNIKVRTYVAGVKQDSIVVYRGFPITITSPCDSINILRDNPTAATVVISYHPRFFPSISSGSDVNLSDISDSEGIWSSPDLTEVVVHTGDNLTSSDTLDLSVDISGYREIYVKFEGNSLSAACDVYFGTSETAGWTTGNAAYFDIDPSTADIDGYQLPASADFSCGKAFPVATDNGCFIAGSYMLIRLLPQGNVYNLSTIVIKRK